MHHSKPEGYKVEGDYEYADERKGDTCEKYSHEGMLDKGEVKGS
jgi:hypothetical protein